MRRTPVLIGTWVLGTVLATTLAWGAVRQVEARVTDQAPVLSEHRVEEALPPTREVGDTATTVPAIPAGDPGAPGAVAPGRPGGGPVATSPRRDGQGTSASPASSPSATTSPAPPTTGGVTSFVAVGGSASFRCSAGSIAFVGAAPRPGFTATTEPGSTFFVRFTSSSHLSVIEAECVDGAVNGAVDEEAP